MVFPVFKLGTGWAMWMLWGGGYFRRLTEYYPAKDLALSANLELK